MNEIAANLATLTEQLNRFKPASVSDVAGSQAQISSAVEERLNLQSSRIDVVSETTHEANKIAQDNADVLQTLLVGLENLGDSVKQLKEEMNAWGGPGDQQELDDLMREVPTAFASPEQPQVSSPICICTSLPTKCSIFAKFYACKWIFCK